MATNLRKYAMKNTRKLFFLLFFFNLKLLAMDNPIDENGIKKIVVGSKGERYSCIVNRSGTKAVTSSPEGLLELYDLQTKEKKAEAKKELDKIYALSDSGTKLFCRKNDQGFIFDLEQQKLLCTLLTLKSNCYVQSEFTFDEKRVVLCKDRNYPIYIFDAKTGECLQKLTNEEKCIGVRSIHLNPNDTELIVSQQVSSKPCIILDLAKQSRKDICVESDSKYQDVSCFSSDNKNILFKINNRFFCIMDLKTKQLHEYYAFDHITNAYLDEKIAMVIGSGFAGSEVVRFWLKTTGATYECKPELNMNVKGSVKGYDLEKKVLVSFDSGSKIFGSNKCTEPTIYLYNLAKLHLSTKKD